MKTGKPLPSELTAAIGSWRQWGGGLRARPRVIKPLEGGRSNHSYLLDAGGEKLVLRLDANSSLLPGGERQAEAQKWQVASDAGIAPPLRFIDVQNGFLISAYIEHQLPVRPQDDPAVVAMAFDLLQRCHELEIETPRMDYHAHVDAYWRMISPESADPALLRQRQPMRDVLKMLLESDTQWGFCHHDPVVVNFVGSPQRLYLIDWEYATRGLQLIDYAALAVEWGMAENEVAARSSMDVHLLAPAKTLYRYLCALWEAVVHCV